MKSLIIAAGLVVALAGTSFAQDVCAPAKVTDLQLKEDGNRVITLKWTAPGDDCNTGNAASWELRWSTSTITDTNWQSATLGDNGSSPAQGQWGCAIHTFAVSPCPQTRYFVLFTFDEAGNRSPMSNVYSTSASCSGQVIPECP